MKNMQICTSPTYHYCHAAKEYFSEKGVAYEEHDVSRDEAARQEMVEKSGQIGVPIIVINGNLAVGFDRPRIAQLLELK